MMPSPCGVRCGVCGWVFEGLDTDGHNTLRRCPLCEEEDRIDTHDNRFNIITFIATYGGLPVGMNWSHDPAKRFYDARTLWFREVGA